VQYERDLSFLGQPRMAAGEHHPKLIVFDRVCSKKLLDDGGEGPLAFEQLPQLWRESARGALAPQDVESAVLCGGHEPCGRVLRQSAEFTHLERAAEGVLHDVFRQREVVNSKDARQRGDHARRFAPKKMIAGLYHMFIFMTGRTSTAPSTSKIGQPLESSTAWSRSRASISV